MVPDMDVMTELGQREHDLFPFQRRFRFPVEFMNQCFDFAGAKIIIHGSCLIP